LATKNALTDEERQAFSVALWSSTDDTAGRLPATTNLLPHAFAELPVPDGVDSDSLVKARLFDVDPTEVLAPPQPMNSLQVADPHNRLLSISAAAQSDIRPTNGQAVRLFDAIVQWRPLDAVEMHRNHPIVETFHHQFYGETKRLAGSALARTIVPALSSDDRTDDRARALLMFIRDASVGTAVAALPYFSPHDAAVRLDIVRCIRRGLLARNFEEVNGSVTAVEIW
jgi:hypothetical protein